MAVVLLWDRWSAIILALEAIAIRWRLATARLEVVCLGKVPPDQAAACSTIAINLPVERGLFGGGGVGANTGANKSGGLFGASAAKPATGGGLFGGGGTSNPAGGTTGGLFGGSSTSLTKSTSLNSGGGGLFGGGAASGRGGYSVKNEGHTLLYIYIVYI